MCAPIPQATAVGDKVRRTRWWSRISGASHGEHHIVLACMIHDFDGQNWVAEALVVASREEENGV
jgi:hypothetical protein